MRSWILILIVFFTHTAIADIKHVPDDFETIIGAVADAEDGDTVLIDPGVYQIDEEINFSGNDIVVASLFLTTGESRYIEETIIDGQGETRIFVLQTRETEDAQIVGLTIRNGRASYGGGIRCSNNATPRFSNLIITGNHATDWGGGIYCTAGSAPTIINVSVVNNSDEGDGDGGRGGLHFRNEAAPVIINSIYWNNDPPDISNGLNITYSDIQGGYDGEGNIDDDPEFEDPEENNYNLTEDSPCLDAGNPESPEDPDETRADMGPLYYEQAPNIAVDINILEFGEVNLGDYRDIIITVISLGPVPLEIESIEINAEDSPFVIVGDLELGTLEVGEELEVMIRFTPVEVAEYEAALIIESNDPEDPTIEIAVTGTGLPAIPNIQVEQDRIVFDETALQRTTLDIVTIQNVGMADLTVGNVRVEGEDLELFSIDFDDEVVIAPDDMIEVEFYFTPTHLGEFRCNVIIESDDEDEGEIEIRVTGVGVLPEQHYDPEWNNGVNHTLLFTGATINDAPLSDGSEIAVFSQNGICCGSEFWLGDTIGFAAWGDDEQTEEVDGFVEDDEMIFVFWDAVSQQEISAEPDFVMGDEIYHVNGLSVLSLAAEIEGGLVSYTLRMLQGWNMVAIPIIPEEDDIIEMWSPVVERDHLTVLKDQDGRFYNPAFRFNNIPFWNFRNGYQVNLTDPDTLVIIGEPIPEDFAIPLEAGWNIINYFLPFETDAIIAFANIVDILAIAKDVNGNFYSPEFGFSNMGNLVQGNGYQVKVTEDGELVWNFEERLAGLGSLLSPEGFDLPSALNTGRNMSVIILGNDRFSEGSEIIAITTEGVVVGSAKVSPKVDLGLTIWGDDPFTAKIDGAVEGEEISFTIVNNGDPTTIEPDWIMGSSVYHVDDLSVMNVDIDLLVPLEFTFGDIHPNPFNNSVKLNFTLAVDNQMKLSVYDISGREIEVLLSEYRNAGAYSYTWNANNNTSGLYILRLESEALIISQKVTLIK